MLGQNGKVLSSKRYFIKQMIKNKKPVQTKKKKIESQSKTSNDFIALNSQKERLGIPKMEVNCKEQQTRI